MELKELENLSDQLEEILEKLTAALCTSQAAEIRSLLKSRRWGTADDVRLFLDILDNPPETKPSEQIPVESTQEPGKRGIFQVANLIKKTP